MVVNFFLHNLKLDDPEKIVINNTHRLGKPPHLVTDIVKAPRDIIVRFQNAWDRAKVWNQRLKLKGSKFFLTEDLSPATQDNVRKLQLFYKAAKKCPEVTQCRLVRDVLLINGQRYTVDSLHTLPYGLHNFNPAERRLKDGKGIAFFGKASFLSNFYDSSFVEEGVLFKTVEHYYQFKRANYFKDVSTAHAIMNAKSPDQAKALSYQIRDFDPELWEPMARRTMHKACLLKFQQNEQLREKLKQITGNIVEANVKDTLFSCGFALDHPAVDDQSKWKGANLLGQILCEVRDVI